MVVFSSDICNGFRYNFKGKGDSYKIHPKSKVHFTVWEDWRRIRDDVTDDSESEEEENEEKKKEAEEKENNNNNKDSAAAKGEYIKLSIWLC